MKTLNEPRHTKKGFRTYAESVTQDQPAHPQFYKVADSVALRSDCTDAQADLEQHCPHMSECPFLHGVSHLVNAYHQSAAS